MPSTRGPPSFATSSRANRKAERAPLLYMDVALGKSRTGRIGVHEGDDPAVLADNFARTYQLDATLRGRLQALIEEQLEKLDAGSASAGRDWAAAHPWMESSQEARARDESAWAAANRRRPSFADFRRSVLEMTYSSGDLTFRV